MYHSRSEESNVVEYRWRDESTKESQEQNEHSKTKEQSMHMLIHH